MKLLKKVTYVILASILLSIQLVIPDFYEETEAKSLKDVKDELAELEKKYAENQASQQATQDQIDSAKNQINKLSVEKAEIEEEIENLNVEIEQLNEDIAAKNEEIKDIISYYQLSATGQDAELEYVFTATDFTDFIYRMAISEQLSDYNDKLISEYEYLIVKNEETKTTLNNKTVELTEKQKELEKTISSLKVELQEDVEGALSIEDEITIIKKTISSYQKIYDDYKCDETDEYKVCLAKAPSNTLPADTAFYRPVVSGRVSSNYGGRTYYLNGSLTSDFHYGVDFSTSHGSKVYSIANGKVVAVVNAKASYDSNHKSVCGGNKVYIVHTVNGKDYTSAYYHLQSYTVKVGDIVTSNTVIGYVGGTSAEYWDNCSTGAHVHLQMATGHYQTDYYTYSGFTAKAINPRTVLNAPSLGGSFSNRTTKY